MNTLKTIKLFFLKTNIRKILFYCYFLFILFCKRFVRILTHKSRVLYITILCDCKLQLHDVQIVEKNFIF